MNKVSEVDCCRNHPPTPILGLSMKPQENKEQRAWVREPGMELVSMDAAILVLA